MPDPDPKYVAFAKAVETLLGRESPESPESPETPAAGAPTAPAAPAVPAEIAALAAQQTGPQPPPGKAPLRTLDEWEALPQAERLARMDEADWLFVHENEGS